MPEAADMDVPGTLAAAMTPPDAMRTAEPAALRATPPASADGPASAAASGFGDALMRALGLTARLTAASEPAGQTVTESSMDGDTDASDDGTSAAEPARMIAHASSHTAAPTTPPEPDRPERSLETLAPAFRTRLDRVVQRMRDEFGYEVRIVETWRSQERQDALFAQGRTADGQTVTWTRHSNHTRGLAADVIVDGSYDNTDGFAKLAQVAADEGLRTLAADPGHIEMEDPTGRRGNADPRRPTLPPGVIARIADIAEPAMPAQPARGVQTVRPASVATPAAPARFAPGTEIARVAGIVASTTGTLDTTRSSDAIRAVPAQRSSKYAATDSMGHESDTVLQFDDHHLTASSTRPATSSQLDASAVEPAIVERARAAVEPIDRPARDPRQGSPVAAGPEATRTVSSEPLFAPVSSNVAEGRPQLGSMLTAARAESPDLAARVARVLALRDAVEATPATGVSLHVDGVEGTVARIRLDLRGSAVATTIDMTDPVAAADLRIRAGELEHALERQGLESRTLVVRGNGETADAQRAATSARVADPLIVSGRTMESHDQHRSPGSPRRDREPPEQRSKRQHREEHT